MSTYEDSGAIDATKRPWSWARALNRLSADKSDWKNEIDSLSEQYLSFVHEFIGAAHAADVSSSDALHNTCINTSDHQENKELHPLASDSKQPALAQLQEDVTQDVERLQPSHPEFVGTCESNRLKAGVRRMVMLHFVLSSSELSYEQGVHELAGVLLFTWAYEAQLEKLVDAEAMSFFCLIDLRAELSHLLSQHELQCFASGVLQLLRSCDFVLFQHMYSLFPPPKQHSLFLIRWLSVLFTHEFDLSSVLLLWDCFMPQMHVSRESALQALCASMLLVARADLLACSTNALALQSVLNRFPYSAASVASECQNMLHTL